MNVMLCGHRVFAEAIKLRGDHPVFRVGPRERRGTFETQRKHCEHGGRDSSYIAVSQQTSGTTQSWNRQGKSLP